MNCDCLKRLIGEEELSDEVSIHQQSTYKSLVANEELEVTCIDSVPNNQIICGDANGRLIAFDYSQGSITQQWDGHAKSITKVCTQEGAAGCDTRVLTSSRDRSLKLWSLGAESLCQQEFKGHHELVVSAAAFSPMDSHVICSGSRDNSIALWDIQSGKVVLSSKIARNLVTDICWKGSLLAQTSEDKTLRLWDAHNMQVTQIFALKQQILTSCDVYGTQIATTSGGFNGTGCEVTVWDQRNGAMPLHEFKGHTEKAHRCCYTSSVDGTVYLASVSADQTIRLWNCKSLSAESCYHVGWQLMALTHLSTDTQSIRFGVASPDSGVHIVTLDQETHSMWEVHA